MTLIRFPYDLQEIDRALIGSDRILIEKNYTTITRVRNWLVTAISAADVKFPTGTGGISAANVQTALVAVKSAGAPLTHVGSKGVSQHGLADASSAGFLSPALFTKLDALDVTLIPAYPTAVTATPDTIPLRDGSADIYARLFRSEYAVTNPTVNYIMTQVDPASNNYLRPSTPGQVAAVLDHGLLLGRSADDHPQYSLVDGSRAYTGAVAGVEGALPAHLVTKSQLDAYAQGVDWQASVLDKDLTAPPASPTTGDRYVVAPSATGTWAGHDNEIAEWDGVQWAYTVPNKGFTTQTEDDGLNWNYNGTAWVGLGSTIDHGATLGLADDDHPQYSLADGSRAFTAAVSGVAGTDATHLVTKAQLEAYVPATLSDADGDTKVETERTPDADVIYLKASGVDAGYVAADKVLLTATNAAEGSEYALLSLDAEGSEGGVLSATAQGGLVLSSSAASTAPAAGTIKLVGDGGVSALTDSAFSVVAGGESVFTAAAREVITDIETVPSGSDPVFRMLDTADATGSGRATREIAVYEDEDRGGYLYLESGSEGSGRVTLFGNYYLHLVSNSLSFQVPGSAAAKFSSSGYTELPVDVPSILAFISTTHDLLGTVDALTLDGVINADTPDNNVAVPSGGITFGDGGVSSYGNLLTVTRSGAGLGSALVASINTTASPAAVFTNVGVAVEAGGATARVQLRETSSKANITTNAQPLDVNPGNVTTGNGKTLQLTGGGTTATGGWGGDLQLVSGQGVAHTGNVALRSNSALGGTSTRTGDVYLSTGSAVDGDAGSMRLWTGASATGDRGGITLEASDGNTLVPVPGRIDLYTDNEVRIYSAEEAAHPYFISFYGPEISSRGGVNLYLLSEDTPDASTPGGIDIRAGSSAEGTGGRVRITAGDGGAGPGYTELLAMSSSPSIPASGDVSIGAANDIMFWARGAASGTPLSDSTYTTLPSGYDSILHVLDATANANLAGILTSDAADNTAELTASQFIGLTVTTDTADQAPLQIGRTNSGAGYGAVIQTAGTDPGFAVIAYNGDSSGAIYAYVADVDVPGYNVNDSLGVFSDRVEMLPRTSGTGRALKIAGGSTTGAGVSGGGLALGAGNGASGAGGITLYAAASAPSESKKSVVVKADEDVIFHTRGGTAIPLGDTTYNTLPAGQDSVMHALRTALDPYGVSPSYGKRRVMWGEIDFMTGEPERAGGEFFSSVASGGTVAGYGTAVSGRAGLALLSVSGSTSATSTVTTGPQVFLGDGTWRFRSDVGFLTLSNGTQGYSFRSGLFNESVGEGVYFYCYHTSNSYQWMLNTSVAGSVTGTVNTSIPVTSGEWYCLELEATDGSEVKAWINGTLVATFTTGLPTGALQVLAGKVEKRVGTALNGVLLDYAMWYHEFATPL